MDDSAKLNGSPNSAEARDIAYHVHPFTNLARHREEGPLVVNRGEGVRLFDASGRGYIEGMAGLACITLGFSEKRLIEAATRQMHVLPFYHSFDGKGPDVIIELAEKLLATAPASLSKVLFANSGSEANDTAVKLIRYYNNALGRPRKKKIIARQNAYHGVTVATASLTGLPTLHRDFDLPMADILRTDNPHFYRCGFEGESEEDFASRCAENLEKLIIEEDPETVAAFFAEPVMGAGGVIVPPPTYFEKVQAVLRKYDVLLVADEVISGYGRTGNMWACQTFDIRPDMISTAKGLSASYIPISALMISEPIYEAMVTESEKVGVFGHGYTYSGHPTAAAVAIEVLNIYEERDIVGHVRKVGNLLQSGLRGFSNHPLVGDVRGIGLHAAVELVKDKKTKTPFDPSDGVGPYLVKRAQAHGLITRVLGDGRSIGFAPPLVISADEITELLNCFGRALDETTAWLEKRS